MAERTFKNDKNQLTPNSNTQSEQITWLLPTNGLVQTGGEYGSSMNSSLFNSQGVGSFAKNSLEGMDNSGIGNMFSDIMGNTSEIAGGLMGNITDGVIQSAVSSATDAISGIGGGALGDFIGGFGGDIGGTISDALGGLMGSFGLGGSSDSNGMGDLRPKLAFFDEHPASNYPGFLSPLAATNGLIWPYRPSIQIQIPTNYSSLSTTHSLQDFHYFVSNKMPTITIGGEFSAQNPTDAKYMLAAIHFLRVAQKMSFGQSEDPTAGTPPPLLKFSAYGRTTLNWLPVFINGYTIDFPNDKDYVMTSDSNGPAEVPTIMTISTNLQVMYTPQMLRQVKIEEQLSGDSEII